MASPERLYQQESGSGGIWKWLALGISAVVVLDVLNIHVGNAIENTANFVHDSVTSFLPQSA